MLFVIAKATSWWDNITLAIKSLVWVVIEDVLISIFITLSWRTSEPYTEWDLHKAQEWKFAMEKSLLFILGTLSTCYIFARAHIDISHAPPRNARLGSLEQEAAMDGEGEEDDEFSDALSQQPAEFEGEEDTNDTGESSEALPQESAGDEGKDNNNNDELSGVLPQQLTGDEENNNNNNNNTNGAPTEALPQQLTEEEEHDNNNNGASTEALPQQLTEEEEHDNNNNNNNNGVPTEALPHQLTDEEEHGDNNNGELSEPLPQQLTGNEEEDNNNDNDELIDALLQQLAGDEADDHDHDSLTETLSQELTDVDADMSIITDSTAVDLDARPPSPRVFLRRTSTESQWRMETLRMLAMSGGNEASDVESAPEGASVNILTQDTAGTPESDSNQALSAPEEVSSILTQERPQTPRSSPNQAILVPEGDPISIITHEAPRTPESNPDQAVPAPEENSVGPQETSETLGSDANQAVPALVGDSFSIITHETPQTSECDPNQATPAPEGGPSTIINHGTPQTSCCDPNQATPAPEGGPSSIINNETPNSIQNLALTAPEGDSVGILPQEKLHTPESDPNQAVAALEGDSVSIMTQKRPGTTTQERPITPQSNPNKAPNATPATPSQTFSEVDHQVPRPSRPIPRRAVSPRTPTAPQSSRRSVLDALTSPAPSFGVPPWSQPASPAPSLAATSPEDDDIFPINPIPSRKGYKDMLYEEAQGWPNTLSDMRLKRLIRYDEDDDSLPITGLPDTGKQQHVYEAFARMQAHMNNTKTFRLYGTPALFPLDRLRCWVLTNNHRERGTPFPPNYVPIGPGGDEVMSVSSIGMESDSDQ